MPGGNLTTPCVHFQIVHFGADKEVQMNSVALPASATGSALGTETDLIRRAARGDGESFEELYRRHSQVAWRFGQAVASDADAAVQVVSEGFGRALRGLRRRNRTESEGFRPLVLAAIYRAAIDNPHSHGSPAPVAAGPARSAAKGRSKGRGADAAFVEAAFRSLPERWRAAIWLSEVEALSDDRIAPILGVSAAVAAQLVSRGRRGLLGRFEQGRRAAPAHLDAALRPLSATVPAGLGQAVGARWASLVNDPAARFAPINDWLSERAVRPLWVSVGGLMGLSLIGLGLVAQGNGVNSGPVAGGAAYGNVNPPGINPSGALSRGFAPINPGSGLNAFNLSSLNGGGSGAFGTGSTAPGFGGYTPPSGGGSTTPPPGTNPPPGGNTGPLGNLLGGGGTGPITSPQPSQLLPSNPVVNVSSSGSTNTVQLLPSSSGSTSTASLSTCSSDGIGLTVGTISYGCAPAGSTTTSPTSTTSSTSTLSGTLSTVTSTLTSGL